MPRSRDGGGASRAPPNAKQQQLQAELAPPCTMAAGLTTNQGLRLADNHHALTAGVRGPVLLEDFVLREKLLHFGRERIPERVVHARGAGAHGYFQAYRSMATYTRAAFLQDPAQRTPVFVRFSTAAGERGSADTVRDVRGFAVKFYTAEGNYDLVGSSMPVFYVQDAMKFPDLVHALKPEPHHGMPQAASAHDTFWDFASLMPETTHMLMWTMSDRALPRSYRMMEGFGVHTFRLVNARGDAVFAKFHWKPRLGVHGLAWDEARQIAGVDQDFHRRDLWEAIARGDFPEWELGVQIVDAGREDQLGFDLLDATKLIPEELVPVQRIGRLVLDRNPDNFFAETEQAAFHPGHVVPGIAFTDDPLLQGRLFAYTDAQLARLGGPNFHELPINRGVCPFHNFQRDGAHRRAIARGRVAYEPNTLGQEDGSEFRVDGGPPQGDQAPPAGAGMPRLRGRGPAFDDHFSQAALFWHSQGAFEKEHIVAAFRFELSQVERLDVRQRMVDNLAHVDAMLARKVAAGLGLVPDPRAAAGRAGFRGARGALAVEESAALRMAAGPAPGTQPIATRRVAVLVADGVDAPGLRPVLQALQDAGARCLVLAPQRAPVATEAGRPFAVDHALASMPSVLFDAVLVAGGARAARALAASGAAQHCVLQAYRHGKAVCALGEGAVLLRPLGLAAGADADALRPHPGVVLGPGTAETARAFVEAIGRHRHWDRPLAGSVPA
ncbi:catalase [Pseudorhodoferax sp.]|uniref:catalase n=1 Tax=Pseudorhodoferax sp. TaxID=1993553 RepID=UPI0039E23E72